MKLSHVRRVIGGVIAMALALVVAGCGGGGSGGSSPSKGTSVSGTVTGGVNAITGSTVTLYATGSGYGSGASALGKATTDANGDFTIKLNCPSGNPVTYLTAVGGNAGAGSNSSIGLIGLSGPCQSLKSLGNVKVNELTTVATEWALAQFTDSSGETIGAPESNVTGMDNSMLLAQTNLVDATTGAPASFWPTASDCASGTPPVNCGGLEKMDTIANILASCVQSTGASSAQCTALFAAFGASGTTLAVAHAMATEPASNVGALFALQAVSPPFAPYLSSAPDAYTLALNYTGGGLDGSRDVAIDAAGDAWVSNCGLVCGGVNLNGSMSKFSPVGQPLSPSAGFTGGGMEGPQGIAVDASGNVWVTNSNASIGSVTELNSSGTPTATSPYTGGTLYGPYDVAIDASGNAWFANYSAFNAVELDSSGNPVANSTVNGLNAPYGIALDAAGNAWVANCGGACLDGSGLGSLSEFSSGVLTSPPAFFTGGGIDAPVQIAVDASGNVWAANYNGDSLTKLSSSGSAISGGSGYTGGGLNAPWGVAIDSAGNAWAANNGDFSVSELSSSGSPISPSTGYTGGGLIGPFGIAIDASGNVWAVNGGSADSITEMIGVASPVKTPLVSCLTQTSPTTVCKP